ncbi:hypothetical protein ACFZAR_23940 [Streptomyces sp. NPDC008222]|uniref:hypothetical protein n=1 Tax=Streptomyces sp. NPDC008222 TaxID=3364820 RepID=UPI0036EDA222
MSRWSSSARARVLRGGRLDLLRPACQGPEPAAEFELQRPNRSSTKREQVGGGRSDFAYACFLAHSSLTTPAGTAIAQADVRWQIEKGDEQGKQLVRLDQYQVCKPD